MATNIMRSYEVASINDAVMRAFVLYDYSSGEATASVEYDGRSAIRRTVKAREGIEYAAIERVASIVGAKAHNEVFLRSLAEVVANKVDAYLYA